MYGLWFTLHGSRFTGWRARGSYEAGSRVDSKGRVRVASEHPCIQRQTLLAGRARGPLHIPSVASSLPHSNLGLCRGLRGPSRTCIESTKEEEEDKVRTACQSLWRPLNRQVRRRGTPRPTRGQQRDYSNIQMFSKSEKGD
jgi:hypothetical protein